MTPSSIGDLITAVTSDTSQVTADAVAVQAAEAAQSNDSAQLTTDQASLASALSTSGPVGSVSADGTTITIYTSSSQPPGYTTETIPVASTVPIPTPPPAS